MAKLPADESVEAGEIRVQVPMRPEIVAKVDELAARLSVGRGRMAAMLLEGGIEDEEWIIRIVSSRFMSPVREMVRRWRKTKGGNAHGVS